MVGMIDRPVVTNAGSAEIIPDVGLRFGSI